MLIERFLGKDNVSGETLDRLLHEKFAAASLFQKMVNVDADVFADVIFNNTGILKKLTGNDLHPGEFKFKKPFAFRNYAKRIFSCNKILDTEDYTDAFFRRILIINFTQQFFGKKDDPDLIDKLCTDEEFSGLLYELLARLPRILREGIRKITSEGMAHNDDGGSSNSGNSNDNDENDGNDVLDDISSKSNDNCNTSVMGVTAVALSGFLTRLFY